MSPDVLLQLRRENRDIPLRKPRSKLSRERTIAFRQAATVLLVLNSIVGIVALFSQVNS